MDSNPHGINTFWKNLRFDNEDLQPKSFMKQKLPLFVILMSIKNNQYIESVDVNENNKCFSKFSFKNTNKISSQKFYPLYEYHK